jgi:SAM-dependent methyltransferase
MTVGTAYDEVAYPGRSFPQSHPDRLATLGRLFGLASADPERCRVLELGCGDGANLLPVAMAFPQARVVGIDLAESAIARGRSAAQALGLANLDLGAGDIARLPEGLGEFDYVIAHGVYSWVPEPVRRALLAACRRHLAPQGVAYVSYNVLPGGHLRTMLREMLLMHTEEIAEPLERCKAAREFLAWVALSRPEREEDSAPSALAREAERLARRSDASLIHDDLSENFHLCYFRDFCAEADAHGLQYLAEAEFSDMQDLHIPKAARERLAAFADDLVSREQYLDFLKERRFRQTLLCHAGLPLQSEIRGDALWELAISSPVSSDGVEVDPLSGETQGYRSDSGGAFLTCEPLLKVALNLLRREWPRAIPATELLQAAAAGCGQPAGPAQRAQLGDFALACFATGAVGLHRRQPPFARWPGPMPRASELARWQVKQSRTVTGLLGNSVLADEPLARWLLSRLDGTRDRAALLREAGADAQALSGLQALAEGRTDPASLAAALEAGLDGMGRSALLRADAAAPTSPATSTGSRAAPRD